MRVLPVNYVNCQPKTSNCRPIGKQGYQQNPHVVPANPSFKSKGTAIAAGVFGAILGGAAFLFAAPVAIVAGAAAVGAIGGAAMAEDNEPLDDFDRYKYTHEY